MHIPNDDRPLLTRIREAAKQSNGATVSKAIVDAAAKLGLGKKEIDTYLDKALTRSLTSVVVRSRYDGLTQEQVNMLAEGQNPQLIKIGAPANAAPFDPTARIYNFSALFSILIPMIGTFIEKNPTSITIAVLAFVAGFSDMKDNFGRKVSGVEGELIFTLYSVATPSKKSIVTLPTLLTAINNARVIRVEPQLSQSEFLATITQLQALGFIEYDNALQIVQFADSVF